MPSNPHIIKISLRANIPFPHALKLYFALTFAHVLKPVLFFTPLSLGVKNGSFVLFIYMFFLADTPFKLQIQTVSVFQYPAAITSTTYSRLRYYFDHLCQIFLYKSSFSSVSRLNLRLSSPSQETIIYESVTSSMQSHHSILPSRPTSIH